MIGAIPLLANFPSGCHVAEIEIDPQTGFTTLVRYTAVDDAGLVLNPVVAEGQIHGGLAQGLGEVFGEAMICDAAGTTGALAAATNAIADALAQAGRLD